MLFRLSTLDTRLQTVLYFCHLPFAICPFGGTQERLLTFLFRVWNLELGAWNWNGGSRNRGDKPKSPPMHGFDVLGVAGIISQGLPQFLNTRGQCRITDHGLD